jgi:4-hydroxybenzoate polyprenyltransferase
VAYFVLQTAYSLRLKKVAYLDVACIAAGFVLRVLAGGFATRTPVSLYMLGALLAALGVTGAASVLTYLAYSLDAHTRAFFRSEWLWLTTIHPLFGVLRFLWLIKSRPDAESPTHEMTRDVPFMLNLVVWIGEVMVIVYRLRPT